MDAVIVLSDFRKDGWQMSKSMVNLSLDHILAAGKSISMKIESVGICVSSMVLNMNSLQIYFILLIFSKTFG